MVFLVPYCLRARALLLPPYGALPAVLAVLPAHTHLLHCHHTATLHTALHTTTPFSLPHK